MLFSKATASEKTGVRLDTLSPLSDARTKLGKSASLGEEAVLADSGRVGGIAAGIGRVRKPTFSAPC